MVEQVKNLCKTKVVQKALEKKSIQVHCWVYDMHNGCIKELNDANDTMQAVHPIFKYQME